ncbi:MAG: hypothetical protein KDE27_02220 [Planctomycetes bacterium]|nr:hypothetical protein [Planctomycetota bacterium]
MRTLASAALLALTAVLRSQTYVVDVQNGPGTNFTSIAAAVAAVPSGAVLDVRPGDYGRFTITGKSLTVLCQPGVRAYDLFSPLLTIDSIPAGNTVLVHGLGVAAVSVLGLVRCSNSTGTIVLDSCRGDQTTSPIGGQLEITNCASVLIRDSSFLSNVYLNVTMQVDRSNVAVSSSTFNNPSAPVVAASQSRLDFTDGRVIAGIQGPTIALHQSHLDLRSGCFLTAALGQAAIVAGSGSVDLDPAVTLQNASPQPFAPGIALTTATQLWLAVTPGAPGGNASGTLSGPGSVAALLLGAPGAPTAVPGLTHPSWLVPGSEIPLTIGSLPLSGGYAVPNAPWIQGVVLGWQGAAASAGTVRLSNPQGCGHY